LLEMVGAGALPATVVDSHKAALWVQVFEEIQVGELALAEDQAIAPAVRKDSPRLLEAMNGFVATAKKGTLLGNILFKRFYEGPERVTDALSPEPTEKLRETFGFIRDHAGEYGFEPLLIAAQGYQESGLDQSKRSHVGAVGIMQVMPATAKDPNVAIPDIDVAERNVEAGVKYLRFLRDRYFDDPAIAAEDRIFLSLAAYNAGPGNLRKARRKAEAMGLDPNVWFGNVEVATARSVSREPVVYVRNILKYYSQYRAFRALGEDGEAAPDPGAATE
ncbi:MAG: transglycosylase SLT domain-containing protein, partial [Pseudomonadota bacterium]